MARRGALLAAAGRRRTSQSSTTSTVVSDTFTRTNASSLGTADTGQAWIAAGGVWSTTGTQAALASGTGHCATTINAGVADCTIACDLPVAVNGGLCFRFTDMNNTFLLSSDDGVVYRVQTGTFTSIGTCSAFGTGTYNIVLAGSSIIVKRNGVQVLSVTDTFNQTVTRHGLHSFQNTAIRWDNYSVTTTTTGGGGGGGTTGVPSRVAGWWWADLEGVPLGSGGNGRDSGTTTANALNQIWDYWDVPGLSVVDRSAEGLPATPWGGSKVAKWHKPAGSPDVYCKLNRTFTSNNFPSGVPSLNPGGTSPADISGRYITYLYIPSAQFIMDPTHCWVQFVQHKENYTDAGGAFHQDPYYLWGGNNFQWAPGETRMTFNFPHTYQLGLIGAFQDKWIKVEIRNTQGVKVELFIDDVLIDTVTNAEQKTGPAWEAPDLAHTQGLVFIAGPYTSNQGTDYVNTDVTTYVGLSCVLPLS